MKDAHENLVVRIGVNGLKVALVSSLSVLIPVSCESCRHGNSFGSRVQSLVLLGFLKREMKLQLDIQTPKSFITGQPEVPNRFRCRVLEFLWLPLAFLEPVLAEMVFFRVVVSTGSSYSSSMVTLSGVDELVVCSVVVVEVVEVVVEVLVVVVVVVVV